MPQEIITNHEHDFIITLHLSDYGNCFCPVCGIESTTKAWRPYDENGLPSNDICKCNFQFGFDDGGFPGPYDASWESYRERWLLGQIEHEQPPVLTLSKKKEQLKNIGIGYSKKRI